MTVYPTWRAGSKVTADRLTQQQTHTVVAGSDQIINNSNAQTNDVELFFPLKINAQYIVETHLAFDTANVAADAATSWSVPTGTTGGRFCFGATSTTASFTDNQITRMSLRGQSFTSTVFYSQGLADQSVNEILSLITTGTAGNVQFRWAQSAATVADTTRLADSFMRVTRVG